MQDGIVTSPAGMYAIPLPYADDIRHLQLGEIGAKTTLTGGGCRVRGGRVFRSWLSWLHVVLADVACPVSLLIARVGGGVSGSLAVVCTAQPS